uniref:TRAF4 variant 4 n=1 Tax=Homo sapiens TaxID=9606 RepID=Q2KJU5_HUMAN|nr:TRAF4 variant 4 [Homo sapiens]
MPGFDYKFLEKPKRRLLCPLCGKPMREPVQVSTCGHRFCDTCLQEFLSEGVFKCPEDQLPLDYAKIYPDPNWKNFQKPGTWRGSLDESSLGFGYPKFISHQDIRKRNYVRDDAVFIRAAVELPRKILS